MNMQRHTRSHLRRSGNVEKSDGNQEMQSIEIAKYPLNFEHADEGPNLFASAMFTRL